MDIAESYVNGVKLYFEGNYAQASAMFSLVAATGDLMGRLGRLFLGRCYWRNAWLAWEHKLGSKAAGHLASAGQLCGRSVELGGFLCRFYHAGGQVDAADSGRTAPEGSAIDMLMAAYDSISSQPTSAQFQMLAGMALCRQDRWEEAAAHFEAAARLDTSGAQALRKLGLCWAAQGDLKRAAESLAAALRRSPGDLVITRELFVAAAATGLEIHAPDNAGKPDREAIEQLAAVQVRESDFSDAFLALPAVEADGEIFELAGAFLARVLKDHDGFADMHYKYASVRQRLGDIDGAIAAARRAVEINPEYIQAHYMLGSLLMATDVRQAAAHLARAVEVGGDYADIRADLGLACKRLGWTEQACEHFNRSLAINGNYDRARDELQKLGA